MCAAKVAGPRAVQVNAAVAPVVGVALVEWAEELARDAPWGPAVGTAPVVMIQVVAGAGERRHVEPPPGRYAV